MLSVTAVTEFLFPFREKSLHFPSEGKRRRERSLNTRCQTVTVDDFWACGGGEARDLTFNFVFFTVEESIAGVFGSLQFFFFFYREHKIPL